MFVVLVTGVPAVVVVSAVETVPDVVGAVVSDVDGEVVVTNGPQSKTPRDSRYPFIWHVLD